MSLRTVCEVRIGLGGKTHARLWALHFDGLGSPGLAASRAIQARRMTGDIWRPR